MENKIVYDVKDICVACGRPARPGEMLCGECSRLAENEFSGVFRLKMGMKENCGQKTACGKNIRIAVMLPRHPEQTRLIRELEILCPNAEIRAFSKKDRLFKAVKEQNYAVIFLGEACGLESSIATGRHIQELAHGRCNLIYVTDTSNNAMLAALWEMHISGILPPDFTGKEIAAELAQLRFPV